MTLLQNVFGFPRTAVQRTYNWDCIFPDVAGATILGIVVSKYCQNVSFGEYNFNDVSEMKSGAFKRFFAGNLDIKNPKASFIIPAPDVVSFYFHAWKNLIVTPEGFYNRSALYKKNIYIIFYGRSGIPTNMIKLIGAQPVTFPSFDLSYSDESVVKFDIEFKVDSVETGFSAFRSLGRSAVSAVSDAVNKVF